MLVELHERYRILQWTNIMKSGVAFRVTPNLASNCESFPLFGDLKHVQIATNRIFHFQMIKLYWSAADQQLPAAYVQNTTVKILSKSMHVYIFYNDFSVPSIDANVLFLKQLFYATAASSCVRTIGKGDANHSGERVPLVVVLVSKVSLEATPLGDPKVIPMMTIDYHINLFTSFYFLQINWMLTRYVPLIMTRQTVYIYIYIYIYIVNCFQCVTTKHHSTNSHFFLFNNESALKAHLFYKCTKQRLSFLRLSSSESLDKIENSDSILDTKFKLSNLSNTTAQHYSTHIHHQSNTPTHSFTSNAAVCSCTPRKWLTGHSLETLLFCGPDLQLVIFRLSRAAIWLYYTR